MINKIVHTIALTCKEATLLMELNEDNALNRIQKIRLQLHIQICKICNLYQQKMRIVKRIIQSQHLENTTLKEDTEKIEQLKVKIKEKIPYK